MLMVRIYLGIEACALSKNVRAFFRRILPKGLSKFEVKVKRIDFLYSLNACEIVSIP